jgi:hypothetical protein
MAKAKASLPVGVLAVSRAPATRWGSRVIRPWGVLPAVPATPPGTRLGPAGAVETWYAGPAAVALHPGDTAHYRDNLAARPSLWIALRAGGLVVAGVTADPYEGEGWAGDPGLVVEAVAMPEPVRARVAAFFQAFHVETPFEKRRRDGGARAGAEGRSARVLDLREPKP